MQVTWHPTANLEDASVDLKRPATIAWSTSKYSEVVLTLAYQVPLEMLAPSGF